MPYTGERDATCDRCGFVYKHFELKDEWTGLKVCDKCWEPRHPQDMLRVPNPEKSPPWTRPEPVDVTITVDYIDSSVGNQETTVPTGTFTNDL